MDKVIAPATALVGSICLPGDKSISHRYAMLAALARGSSRIDHFSTGADCHSTLDCLRALGVPIREENTTVHIDGVGLDGLRAPAAALDAGNSGSTIRMLSGILAAQPFSSEIAGDASLARRPMRRIIEPLSQMGARIEAREGNFPPLRITGGPLRGIDYQLPVPSAQVKTAVLLAGLFAEGPTTVREGVRTRDHTEIALRELGASISVRRGVIRVEPRPTLQARHLVVPSDLSAAAFFLVAALMLPGSDVLLQGVGLNPTRSALLDVLASMGGQINVADLREQAGELVGDIRVRSSAVRGGVIQGSAAAAVIDEIPVLAVLGAASEKGLIVKDAAELRVKETDRIATVAENLRRMGVAVTACPDGLEVRGRGPRAPEGGPPFHAAEIDSFGDHRIAMAFAVAALAADGPSTIHGAEAASVSFPEFYETLDRLRA
ncbi:MAG TPA: 3-phosphoshikimate 1-carboxyvinyltransferase [Bryobacterales bacterium]|nr:3-phosphoshikimate 1-carboxyvinyltransferase [Bryobacterales bacterium]